MRAHATELTKLISMNGATFNIPVYQRNYDWNTDNCSQLFNDLETIVQTNKHHFIGSIVYISVGSATEPNYNIIDGQQRITSVMLLMRALYDASEDPVFRRRIKANLLVNADFEGNISVRLKQIESDGIVYDKLITMDKFYKNVFSEAQQESNVFKNYTYFSNRISKSRYSEKELFNAIYSFDIIDVCLENEDPQAVFESLNSTGKALTNTDLLRNYLLMAIPNKQQEDLYNRYWAQIEKNVGLENVEQFMLYFLIMKRKTDSFFPKNSTQTNRTKITKTNLYAAYKQYLLSVGIDRHDILYEKTESFLKEVYEYSFIFKKFVNEEKDISQTNALIHELMNNLKASSTSIFLMYLFGIKKKDKVSDEDMIQAIEACISYVVRRKVLMLSNSSNQFFSLAIQKFDESYKNNSFINSVWKAITAGNGSYRFPSNEEFRETIENKKFYEDLKPPFLVYFLYQYERKRTKELVDYADATVEHILPQNTNLWKEYLLKQKDNEYEKHIHTIGNLTLTKYNSEMSNKLFSEKRMFYTTSGFALNREIASTAEWNSKEIRLRTKKMAKEALIIWRLPDEYNTSGVTSSNTPEMHYYIKELYEQFRSIIQEFFPEIVDMPAAGHVNYVLGKERLFSLVPNQASLYITLNIEKDSWSGDLKIEENKRHKGVGKYRTQIKNEEDIWEVVGCIEKMKKTREDLSAHSKTIQNKQNVTMGTVKHEKFGKGEIVKIEGDKVFVRFEETHDEKQFEYPYAFEKQYLKEIQKE